MRRTGYVGLSLTLILVFACFGFSQAPKAPAAKTQAEYDAFEAFRKAPDAQKKAAAGEKFLIDFKESELIPATHRMIIGAYSKAQNWAKTIDSADRAAALTGADAGMKAFAYASAMDAAQNMNNLDKAISYGDKVLAVAPNELNTMIALSALIPAKLPADEAGKKTALDKASSLATKALAEIEKLIPTADAQSKPQLIQIQSNLHATLGLIAYDRADTKKSIEEYDTAVKGNPKDDVAYYYVGANYSVWTAQASKEYQAAFKAWNDAKVARADQPTIDELDARQQGLANDIQTLRDKAIDSFATSVAIGGPIAPQARAELTKLWTTKNPDTSGLDAFIAQKK